MGILVITVDLQCCRCRAKITKVLDCLKEEFCIEKVEFEDKDDKVVVRGKYDADKLCRRVWCKAGKVVKAIVIVDVWPPPAPPAPPKPCPKPDPCKCCKPDPPKHECCKPEPCKCCKHKHEEKKPKEDKPKEEPKKQPPAPPKTEYKLVPYPYPMPYYPTMCQSWPWKCPPQQPCHGCAQPAPAPPAPAPPPPPQPQPPCRCPQGHCGGSCMGPVWGPTWPAPPPPWVVVPEENSCSVM